jgi:hypothetical protein
MELDEFHIAEPRAGAVSHRVAIARGNRRVRRFPINLSAAAGGQNRLAGPDEHLFVMRRGDERSAASAIVREQIERERVFPDAHMIQAARPFDDRPHDLLARHVAQGMDDAAFAVAAFAAEDDAAGLLVEVRAPVDQLLNPLGRLADDHLDDFLIAKRAAGDERVADVQFEAVFGIEHARNPALGIAAVRLVDRVLRHHQHAQPRIDRISRPQARQAAANDQHIRKEMRQLAGVERDEIARREQSHRPNISLARARRAFAEGVEEVAIAGGRLAAAAAVAEVALAVARRAAFALAVGRIAESEAA